MAAATTLALAAGTAAVQVPGRGVQGGSHELRRVHYHPHPLRL